MGGGGTNYKLAYAAIERPWGVFGRGIFELLYVLVNI